jgi:beta-galactosidase
VTDELTFTFQTKKWEQPALLLVEKLTTDSNKLTIEVKLVDKNGTLCLDAANFVRFKLLGDGRLIDHLGTSRGSNYVQLYNGRALITAEKFKGKCIISAEVKGLPSSFLEL